MPTLCRRSSHLNSDTQEESSSLTEKLLNQAPHLPGKVVNPQHHVKTFILPVIAYCYEPLISASKQVRKSLEIFHNQALRLITGAVKTSPIDAMLLCTRNWPLEK
ncbi:hypothetical protein CEXT_665321 [Caerostris extrusa]|uniref:Uncharacterized protein n=1 Tax=Caerostris extrusa TaxID=172846 RepID=A0AAV4PJG8_CAEEX|nr:hypothetical protein CEXT_665321 [Caerostris extrusa]